MSSAALQGQAGDGTPQAAIVAMVSQGTDAFSGAVGADAYLTVTNVSDDNLPAIINAIKSSDTALGSDPSVAAVNALLPADRISAIYVRIPGLPANTPLLGMTIGTSGSGVRYDMYISGQTAMGAVKAAQDLYGHLVPTPAPTPGPSGGPGTPMPTPGGGL
jgi:hypothetical protein